MPKKPLTLSKLMRLKLTMELTDCFHKDHVEMVCTVTEYNSDLVASRSCRLLVGYAVSCCVARSLNNLSVRPESFRVTDTIARLPSNLRINAINCPLTLQVPSFLILFGVLVFCNILLLQFSILLLCTFSRLSYCRASFSSQTCCRIFYLFIKYFGNLFISLCQGPLLIFIG